MRTKEEVEQQRLRALSILKQKKQQNQQNGLRVADVNTHQQARPQQQAPAQVIARFPTQV